MNDAGKLLVLAMIAGFSLAAQSSPASAQEFDFGRDVATPFLQGLMEGMNNQNNAGGQNSGGGMKYKYEAPSQSGSGWNNWQNNNGNWGGGWNDNSGGGWNNWQNNGGWNNSDYYDGGGYVQPQPNYNQQYYSQPRSVARPESPPPAPVVAKKEIVPITPKANAVSLKGRSITAAEIQSGKTYFGGQLQQMVSELEQELRGTGVDQAQLIAELTSKQVPSETQLQILQAVKNGDAAQTQILWTAAAKDVGRASELYKKVATEQLVKDLRNRADSTSLTSGDVREARGAMSKLELDPSKKRAVGSILDVMDDTLKIQNAVTSAVPGAGTDSVGLPAGSVSIIMNPKLPAAHAVSLGNGHVMIGTGGVGSFELTTGSVAQAMGLPIAPGSPVPANDTQMTLDGVVLINPSNTGTTVHYRLKDTDYTMDPGYTQALAGDSWLVDFHRGGSFGRKNYTVSAGTFAFTPTGQGWELYAKTFKTTIDNSDNSSEFHYAVQNEHASVAPRQTKAHTSKYPIYIRFDRGNGASIKQVKVQDGVLKVAVNPSDGLWDLYSPESTGGSSSPGGNFTPAF
ncbi:MAG: hypothetical protein HUU20_07220 [Pirellulales bacterium]|nr:hypothetical protein [Pirellulales bacterium]